MLHPQNETSKITITYKRDKQNNFGHMFIKKIHDKY